MRILTDSLAAAQKQASATPYVKAVFSDYHGEVSRARFERHYAGSEGDYFSAVTRAGDGSLVRARIDPSTKVLYTQRVASPTPGSTWSSWNSIATVSASGAVALAASSTTVYLFCVDADTLTLKVRESSDNGATFGAAATVATAAAAVTYLAAAVSAGGDVVLLWNVGATVWNSRYSGSWSTPAPWTNNVASVTGLACKYRTDWDVVICGTESTSLDAKVWTALYGDDGIQPAGTWSSLVEVTTATAGTGVSFLSPAIEFLQHWRLFFVETYTGTVAYSRLQASTMSNLATFEAQAWREPFALDSEGDYGVSATIAGGRVWLASASGVWSAAVPSWSSLDVSVDLVEAAVELNEYDGHARIVLRNDPAGGSTSGRYAACGEGALAALQRGARLQLAAGYHTSEGDEASEGPAYWVEAIEQTTGPAPQLIVRARDAWWLLEQWRARRQFFWSAGTLAVSQLLDFICHRAGLELASSSFSSSLTTLAPAFTIHPGEDGKTAVRRLLSMVPDEAIAAGSFFTVVYPHAEDTPVYAYGQGHAIVSAHYRDSGRTQNRTRVVGAGVFSEAIAFGDALAAGERIGLVNDLNVTSSTLAEERAETELRRAEVRARNDELTLFGVNCGQELYDLVTITDAQAGLDDAPRRVLGLSWRYSTGATGSRARYEMTLPLGNS